MDKFNFFGKTFKITFWFIIIFETISFLGFNFPSVDKIVFILLTIATFIISLRKLEYGLWIILTELFIGSFGYLFSYNIDGFNISIRLGLFLALFLAWLIYFVRTKKLEFKKSNLFWPFVLLICFIILGFLIGYLKHNGLKNIFFDANGYLYFGLIFIAFTVINDWRKINRLFQVMIAAVSVMAIKTLVLLFYFSHTTDENAVRLVYRWVRDTRVGEITQFSQNFFRVFFQSHIYALFIFLILFILLVLITRQNWDKKNYRMLWLMIALSSLTLIISFSRSFWLALAMTLFLIFLYLVLKEKIGWRKIMKVIGIMILVSALEIGFLTFLITVKIPGGKGGGPSAASLIRERLTATEEAAIGSRYQLLKPLIKKSLESPIWGSGFGATVTYQTLDPRTKELSGGYYTSYAFEWGYLDTVVKMGLLGLLTYLFFLWKILKNGLDILKHSVNREIKVFVLGLLFGFLSLIVTHFTTPYLNHPLGIGIILICIAVFNTLANEKKN